MLKWFRKYNKHLLVVFMAALLVVWLGGQALEELLRSDDSNQLIAKAFGSELRQSDLMSTYSRADVLTGLGYPCAAWRGMWQVSLMDLGIPPGMADVDREPLSMMEWYMLVESARRQNVAVSDDEVQQFKRAMPDAATRISQVRDRSRVSLAQIDEAIADFLRVREATRRAASAVHVTEPEIRNEVKQVAEKVRVEFVSVAAEGLIDREAPLDDEQLRSHFEQYRNYLPGAGPDLGFGYRKEAAIQFEYVVADAEELAKQIEIDDQKAFTYWRAHRDEFIRPELETQPTTDTAPAEPAATQPVPYEHFDEAKAEVVAKLLDEQVQKEAIALMNSFISHLNQAWRTAETGEDGYLVAPEAVKGETYLQQAVESFAKKRYGNALRYHKSDWREINRLMAEPGIGQTRGAEARTPVFFSRVGGQVQGLAERPTAAGADRWYLAMYQPSPDPLIDRDNNVYMYRVVAARESAPPASIDEVREQVENDFRLLQGYRVARESAEQLAKRAATNGLAATMDADPELRAKLGGPVARVMKPEPFARQRVFGGGGQWMLMPTSVPGIGAEPAFVQKCFELGESPTSDTPNRVTLVEHKRNKAWIVVQWIETLPVREDVYEQERVQVALRLFLERVGGFLKTYYDEGQIRQRAGWEDILPEGAKKSEEQSS
ncbi:MAG: hypothetical protein JXA69_09965 [Phycisphaerae bacterium]|nr:hypothetical protein [Phycisphaerae bacterium]